MTPCLPIVFMAIPIPPTFRATGKARISLWHNGINYHNSEETSPLTPRRSQDIQNAFFDCCAHPSPYATSLLASGIDNPHAVDDLGGVCLRQGYGFTYPQAGGWLPGLDFTDTPFSQVHRLSSLEARNVLLVIIPETKSAHDRLILHKSLEEDLRVYQNYLESPFKTAPLSFFF